MDKRVHRPDTGTRCVAACGFPGSDGGISRCGAPVQVRRLTHSQYNNTVRDLLGDETRPADQFPPEDFLNGFKNQTSPQEISPLLAEAYDTAAEKLARDAFAGDEDSNHLIPCQPRSGSIRLCAEVCARASEPKLSPSAHGRGRRRYQKVLLKEAQHEGQFIRGAQLVVEAMLQSPKFLFRLETGAYKAASDLSYFLWDTMPDERLFQAAASGDLETEAGVAGQAERMLTGPARPVRQWMNSPSEWLRFDQVMNTVKDRNLVSAVQSATRRGDDGRDTATGVDAGLGRSGTSWICSGRTTLS